MLETFLSGVFTNQWLVLGFSFALLVLATELGYRFGLRLYRTQDEARRTQIGPIQGALLGLLALLVGFTFALSVSRYETRRNLIVDEANAIGTCYLRAALLPDAHRGPVEELLREYVQVRLDFFDAGNQRDQIMAAVDKAAAIQGQLWTHAVAAGKDAPTPIVATFITSLNEVIDIDATRLNALRTHVPGAVWLILLAVATCGCYISGYAAGASGARSGFSCLVMPLVIALVIALIVDLDHPRGGLITIKQQALVDLQGTMGGAALVKP
jgi:hypothetical protein